MADPQAPNIPADAPQDVKDFFDCKGDKLVWKKGKVTWLTIKVTDDVEVTPEVSFEHGKAAGSIQISVSLTGISGTVGASVNADGQLVIDDVSMLLKPFKGKLDDAVKTINDWFKHNHKKLKPAVLKKGEVTLEKTATTGAYAPPPVVPFDEDDDQNEPQNVSFTPGWTPGPPTEVQSAPPSLLTPALLLLLIGVAIFGLIVGFFVFFGGPGPVAQASPTPSASPTASPTAAPSTSPTASATATPPATPSQRPTASPASSLQAYIGSVCVRVKHDPIGQYVSYLDWLMYWYGYDVNHFELTIEGANNNAPVTLVYNPQTDGWVGQLGLFNAGAKPIGSLIAVLADGSTVDVTPRLVDYLGFDTFDVRFPQEDSFGNCPGD